MEYVTNYKIVKRRVYILFLLVYYFF
jgi:hypothetical protein